MPTYKTKNKAGKKEKEKEEGLDIFFNGKFCGIGCSSFPFHGHWFFFFFLLRNFHGHCFGIHPGTFIAYMSFGSITAITQCIDI